MNWTTIAPVAFAAFMASLVEFVEALTIVLAVGVVRGWRSALLGTAAALAVLLGLVAALGPALTRIPLQAVQVVVGTLLLLFGLRWLKKAILRASGVLALHDESKAFAEQTAVLRKQDGTTSSGPIDLLAFTTSFKIVMLEGVEVVFIVIAVGAGGALIPAIFGAALALLAVVGLGLCFHRPLSSVPENTLKFGVGVLLSAFGAFWVGEGIGIRWPGEDGAIVALIAMFLVAAAMLAAFCRRLAATTARRRALAHPLPRTPSRTPVARSRLGSISAAAVAFFVDDGWMASGIVLWIVFASYLHHPKVYMHAGTAVVFSLGLAALLAFGASRRAAR